MLSDVIDLLADPVDGTALSAGDAQWRTLVSDSGHSYDIARQGYVTLAGGAGLRYSGDDAAMISARETFLTGGHFAPFVEAVTHKVEDVLDEVRTLAGNGYQEVVLTGIHLSSYGIDFDGNRHLLSLIQAVHQI